MYSHLYVQQLRHSTILLARCAIATISDKSRTCKSFRMHVTVCPDKVLIRKLATDMSGMGALFLHFNPEPPFPDSGGV